MTRGVGELSAREIEEALESGAACARKLLAAGLINGAALRLHGEMIVVGTRAIKMAGSQTLLHERELESPDHA